MREMMGMVATKVVRRHAMVRRRMEREGEGRRWERERLLWVFMHLRGGINLLLLLFLLLWFSLVIHNSNDN